MNRYAWLVLVALLGLSACGGATVPPDKADSRAFAVLSRDDFSLGLSGEAHVYVLRHKRTGHCYVMVLGSVQGAKVAITETGEVVCQ